MVWMHHHKSGIPAGHQVHHVNHKKVNNNPHNLQLLTVEEHSKHHTEERLKGGWVPSGRDISGAKNPMIEWWGRATEEEKALYRKRMSRSTSLEKNGRWVDVGNDVLLRVGYEIYQERGKLTAVIWQKYAKEKGFPQNLSARFGLFTHFREACISFNHKVSSVEPFGTTDVYCMTVDGDANFAVVTKTSDRKHSGVIVHNCGDVLRLQLKINPETEIIEDAKAKTFGCGSAIASSSLVTEWVRGRTLSEAMLIKNTHIADELTLPPVKLHCSVLAEDAIKSAIADFRKKQEAKRAVK
jgi:nitrogen fixation NifU-like protein